MASLTRAQLRTRSKQRADMESTTFVADAEWDAYIDESASELHDLILLSDPTSMRTLATIAVIANTEAYTLPAAFYKAEAVYFLSGGIRYSLTRFDLHDLGNGAQTTSQGAMGGSPYRYTLLGNEIWFHPKPSSAGSVELFYYPSYTRLINDGATVDYPVVNGWEQFIILGATIKAKMKEESDVRAEMAEKAELKDRIRKMADKRDHFEPMRTRDVYGSTNRFRRLSLNRSRHW